MFGTLTEKFTNLFANFTKQKKITESNIADAVAQVRLALLDADVSYSVVSSFIKKVKEKALGDQLIKSVSPGDQFIKIIHDELVAIMGSEEPNIEFKGSPYIVLMCGLQGAGKTTQCAKLAAYLKKKNLQKKVLVAACDLQRPAAIEQLKLLCSTIDVNVHSIEGVTDPTIVARSALKEAKDLDYDVLIIDTAGRLHVDEVLMQQLVSLKKELNPQAVFYVANAAMGQDAVKTAVEFDTKISMTGTILTMLDSTARAGAAISISQATLKPLIFEGIGEKIGDFQLFNPHSMADRILGQGDIVNLVKKAQEEFDENESAQLEAKLRKASFTYNDYLKQMNAIKKMGPLKSLLQMMPGGANLSDIERSADEFKKTESMILSMNLKERYEKVELIPSRRWRIAKGSGTTVDDVNRLVKNFKKMKEMLKHLPNKKQLEKLEKFSWR